MTAEDKFQEAVSILEGAYNAEDAGDKGEVEGARGRARILIALVARETGEPENAVMNKANRQAWARYLENC